mmetsp:Transcript_15310/g.44296  ORF Transcript_15310/g.44296 Transcript_15310/m.44296 type:complete len:278 (-) Transcript_15310:257-1090(-)
MAQIDAFADLTVNLVIRFQVQGLMLSLVLEVDKQSEEMRIDMLEHGVHVDKVPFREGWDDVERAAVQMLAQFRRDGGETMVGQANVLVTINFEEVATERIDDESTHPELVIVFKVQNVLGVTQRLDELLLGTVKGKLVECRLLVLGQGVVHIKPDGLESAHPQFAVAKHIISADGSEGVETGEGRDGILTDQPHTLEKVVVSPAGRLGRVGSRAGAGRRCRWRYRRRGDGIVGQQLFAPCVFVKVKGRRRCITAAILGGVQSARSSRGAFAPLLRGK